VRRRGWRSTVSAGGADTFERFTERARQAVVLAQDEARSLGHPFIAPEHLFLGLLREEQGLAARVLESLGADYGRARAAVAERHGEGDARPTGQIPFLPAAKESLELALREALGLGHTHIGTEHLLLGLTRVETDVFSRLGLAAGEVHEAMLAAFAHDPGSIWERAIDTFRGGEPWSERVDAWRREGWEIVRVTVERRRRRDDSRLP
jgi:ATP-dependent Clp protease ATP-binding subunit ClpA